VQQTRQRGRPRFTIDQWRARAADAGVEADVVQANTDDPTALQQLTNNDLRRSRRQGLADQDSIMEDSQQRLDDRERRTDDLKATDRNADAERRADLKK
jgi:hypothetical protein